MWVKVSVAQCLHPEYMYYIFARMFITKYCFITGEDLLISADPARLLEFVDKMDQCFVVQKYIENPLLLDHDRKFDIR